MSKSSGGGEVSKRTRSWRDAYPIHPSADVFPQMDTKELRGLAKDIQANTLQHKVLLWNVATPEGDRNYLLDGRNRLDAMELAGIQILDAQGLLLPHLYETLADMSSMTAGALAVALNVRRRHLPAEERARLTAAALQADKEFRIAAARKESVPNPTAEQSAVGITEPVTNRDAKGRMKKGSESPNKSAVARVAASAGVHRDTARKAAKALKAEEDMAREHTRARVIEMIANGQPQKAICRELHVGTAFVKKVRHEIGASKVSQLPVAKESAAPAAPPTKRKNEDKHLRGILDELDEIDPDDLTDPAAMGRALIDHGKRFQSHRKEAVAS